MILSLRNNSADSFLTWRKSEDMYKRYRRWYESLTPGKQLLSNFIGNYVYWFVAWRIFNLLLSEENESLSNQLGHALWMATFMTMFHDWKRIKALFKKNTDSVHSNDDVANN